MLHIWDGNDIHMLNVLECTKCTSASENVHKHMCGDYLLLPTSQCLQTTSLITLETELKHSLTNHKLLAHVGLTLKIKSHFQ